MEGYHRFAICKNLCFTCANLRVCGFVVKIVACGPQKILSPPHFRFRHNLHALMYDESQLAVAMSFEGVST